MFAKTEYNLVLNKFQHNNYLKHKDLRYYRLLHLILFDVKALVNPTVSKPRDKKLSGLLHKF